jgi:hypothetical protein
MPTPASPASGGHGHEPDADDPRLAIRRHTDRCFHRVEELADEGYIVQGFLIPADEVAEVVALDAAGVPLPGCRRSLTPDPNPPNPPQSDTGCPMKR